MTDGMFGAKGTGDTSGYGGLVRKTSTAGSSERPYGRSDEPAVLVLRTKPP